MTLEDAVRIPGSRRVRTSGAERQVELLTRACADDFLDAIGVGGMSPARRALRPLLQRPARGFARKIARYDEIVGESGLRAGAAWALARFTARMEVFGRERVPRTGPLLIVSNHPGLSDTVALFSAIPRDDLLVLAAERPFLRALTNTSRRLLYIREDGSETLSLLRKASGRLREGGAILTFPGGRIEPDPAVLPGAAEAIERWSSSVDLLVRLSPGLTVVPAVVSGVVCPAALRHPLARLRRRKEDRERLAAALQVISPRLQGVAVQVRFGRPVRAGESPHKDAVSRAVVAEARRLLAELGP